MMLKSDKRYYIAGPMSGYPQFNVPLFNLVAACLRSQVPDPKMIVSPAELDSPAMQKLALESRDGDPVALCKASGETWSQVLSRDVLVIGDHIDGIIALPGWEQSPGARLEVFTGLLKLKRTGSFEFGLWKYYFENDFAGAVEASAEYMRQQLRENMP